MGFRVQGSVSGQGFGVLDRGLVLEKVRLFTVTKYIVSVILFTAPTSTHYKSETVYCPDKYACIHNTQYTPLPPNPQL